MRRDSWGRPGPERGSDDWKQRARHGREAQRETARRRTKVGPADLNALRRDGVAARPAIAVLARAAIDQKGEIADALGGLDVLSPQRLSLLDAHTRLDLIERAEVRYYAQTEDHDAVPRITTLARARLALLTALGLDRVARDLDLDGYLANGAGPGGDEGVPQLDLRDVPRDLAGQGGQQSRRCETSETDSEPTD